MTDDESIDKILTVDEGGELGEMIKKLNERRFSCSTPGCPDRVLLNEFRGYPHESGLPNTEGEKYWLYWECPTCAHKYKWKVLDQKTLN